MAYYEIASYLLKKTSCRPEVGIICGSGLSGLANALDDKETFPYESIPGFPHTTVQGHTGELVFGSINGIKCVCLRGRFHFYEGNDMAVVTMPVRVMRLLGVKLLIVTNAAGGLNPSYNVGDIAIIHDHIGIPILAGNNPLRGENDDNLGPRFPSVSDAYSSELNKHIENCAEELNLSGVIRPKATYCFVSGPTYETIAEVKFLRLVGGDTVGMSTIPEVIVAKHCGMAVVGLSLVTNKALSTHEDSVPASHEEVLHSVKISGQNVEAIVKKFVSRDRIGDFLSKLPAAPPMEKGLAAPRNCSFSIIKKTFIQLVHSIGWQVTAASILHITRLAILRMRPKSQ